MIIIIKYLPLFLNEYIDMYLANLNVLVLVFKYITDVLGSSLSTLAGKQVGPILWNCKLQIFHIGSTWQNMVSQQLATG